MKVKRSVMLLTLLVVTETNESTWEFIRLQLYKLCQNSWLLLSPSSPGSGRGHQILDKHVSTHRRHEPEEILIRSPVSEFELGPSQCLQPQKPLYGLNHSGGLWTTALDKHHHHEFKMKIFKYDHRSVNIDAGKCLRRTTERKRR